MTRSAVKKAAKNRIGKDGNPVKDPKGLAAAGLGIAVLPFAVEQIAKRVAPRISAAASGLTEEVKETAKGAATEKLKPQNLARGALPSILTSDGAGDEERQQGRAAPGYGSGRRMPIQQGVSVAVPLKTAYNQWTQFESWPEFMHRLESVEQVDDATVAFTTKVWGIRKRFLAKIVEQRPDQRIEWNAEQGLSHTGVVTFHRLSDRLTQIEVDLDLEPHGLLEKAGRGLRFAKRAIRGDLHRFKAFVELTDETPRGWRGTISEGKVKRKTDRPSSRRPSARSRSGASRRGNSGSPRRRSSARSGSRG
jgi:uncharacterized membrane protein